jgi:hypothetical protein
MRRTKLRSRIFKSGDVEAHSRQIARDFGFPFRVAGRLLHDKPFCSGVDPDAEHVGPQGVAVSPSMDCSTNARALAGRTTNDEIASMAWMKCSHVIVHRDAGELVGNKASPPFVELDELGSSETARGFEAKSVSADAAKEIDDIHGSLQKGTNDALLG